MKPLIKLTISIAIPVAVGAVAGFFTSSSVNDWYVTLNKPSFNPPGWLFGPVWTLLYILMGIAFYLIWEKGKNSPHQPKAFLFYWIQLALNFAWSFIFFYAKQPGWAFVEIVIMWIFILLTIAWFSKINKVASWLLVPYICWVSFAAILNFSIWYLNR